MSPGSLSCVVIWKIDTGIDISDPNASVNIFTMLKAGEYCKRKHFLRYLRKQREYLALNVSAYISDDGSSRRNINWRREPYNENRIYIYRSKPIICFLNPISERRRKKRNFPLFRNYILYRSPFSLLGSSQVFHLLTWLVDVDVAEQNFRYDEPGQQAHQQKRPLHCKRNESLPPPPPPPPPPSCRYTVLLLKSRA